VRNSCGRTLDEIAKGGKKIEKKQLLRRTFPSGVERELEKMEENNGLWEKYQQAILR